jgi:hypothetical protein
MSIVTYVDKMIMFSSIAYSSLLATDVDDFITLGNVLSFANVKDVLGVKKLVIVISSVFQK